MSRTYRRKTGDVAWWLGWDYEVRSGQLIRVYLEGKALKKAYNRYHSDAYDPCTPSKLFRRYIGHKYDRARTRECIKREMLASERGDVIFPPTRDIAWEWD